jgi:alpha-L-fucosidase
MESIQPKPEQLAFQSWEFGVFFHFGIRTFNEGHRDWDMQEMKLESFRPARLDCMQWIETIWKAGAKYAILVCKHHDGFANWPSKYTSYSVANTSWQDGAGDVVRAFTDACRAFGVKVGLYYSPAEFGLVDRSAREYDDYFLGQIGELLTRYGRIDYLWFDGNGSNGHTYDVRRIVPEIRRLQPGILLFNMWDPDTRWVGNECGLARLDNPCVVSALSPHCKADAMIDPERSRFLPAECDCMMRRRNWFYSDQDEDTVKSLPELMGIYDASVGRGANLLINIGPNRDGLLPEKDANRLLEFGEALRERFAYPLPAQAQSDADGYTLTLAEPALVNTAVLLEKPNPVYAVERFRVEVYPSLFGDPVPVYYGGTIGHKAICTFPAVWCQRIRIVSEAGALNLADAKVYEA